MFDKTAKAMLREYHTEFLEREKLLIKNRIGLFCALAVALYFFASIISIIVDPATFQMQEVPAALILLVGAVIISRLNSRAATLARVRANAYIFTVFLLSLLIKIGLIYKDDAGIMASVFVFTLFLVSITIPWMPYETAIIGAMHMGAYTVYFLCIRLFMPNIAETVLSFGEYTEGLLFLFMSISLCLVVRQRDYLRDIKDFVLLKQIEAKNRQIQKELEFARRIQKTLVPNSISTEKVDIEVSYLPASYIGGDYAKFHFLDKDRLVFMISDVTGHGVSAALLVNRIHAEFERLAKEGKEPGKLLSELDDFIKGDFEGTDMYLSAFCGLLDFRKMRMVYSNHGHPPQCLYHVKGAFVEGLPAQTSMLGLPIEDKGVEQSEVKFEEGDRILLFTDGVTEARTTRGEEYGDERLEAFLRDNWQTPPPVFNEKLIDELRVFSGSHKFADDVFILHIAIKGRHGFFN